VNGAGDSSHLHYDTPQHGVIAVKMFLALKGDNLQGERITTVSVHYTAYDSDQNLLPLAELQDMGSDNRLMGADLLKMRSSVVHGIERLQMSVVSLAVTMGNNLR
jgi:hypothetical protein